LVLLLCCLVAGALPAHAEDAALLGLAWLAGCWQLEGDEPGSGETWMPPAGGVMLGVARTVRGGRSVAHEFMQIRVTGPGQLAFTALPSGQAEATFPAVRVSATEVVFENPSHDFPQRVSYRQRPDGGLLARIEGRLDGVARAMDYPMRRIRCEHTAAAH
jgi:hypothetical protein